MKCYFFKRTYRKLSSLNRRSLKINAVSSWRPIRPESSQKRASLITLYRIIFPVQNKGHYEGFIIKSDMPRASWCVLS